MRRSLVFPVSPTENRVASASEAQVKRVEFAKLVVAAFKRDSLDQIPEKVFVENALVDVFFPQRFENVFFGVASDMRVEFFDIWGFRLMFDAIEALKGKFQMIFKRSLKLAIEFPFDLR